jgi:hypothetical protein
MVRKQLAALVLVVLTAVACSSPPASSLTVASQSPSPGATGVTRSAVVAVVFDQAIDAATLPGGFTLTSGGSTVPGAVTYDATNRTARYTPTDLLAPDTTFTATVTTSVRGTDGARLASPLTWTFTTVASLPVVVTITPPTNGTITANPTPPYATGDVVTFSANPASGFTHAAWGGACAATAAGQDCVLTLTSDVTVSASFTATAPGPIAFTITQSAGGNVAANPPSPVASGTSVTFTATPDTGFTHTAWGGACTGQTAGQTCTLTITSPVNVTATFTATAPSPIAFTITQSAGGNVAANPPSPVASGTSVTFTATPDTGFTHTAWGGACTGQTAGQTCTLTITSPVNVSATFTAVPTEGIVVGASASAFAASGKDMAIDRPTGLAVGDLLIAHVAYTNTSRTVNGPDGWSEIAIYSTTGLIQAAYFKVATEADVDTLVTYTWSISGAPLTGATNGAAVALTHVTNVGGPPVFGFDGAASVTADTTIAAPSVADAPPGSLVLALFSSTTGFVQDADAYVSDMTTAYATEDAAVRLLGVHEILAAGGATGDRTATVATSGSPRIGQSIVIRPN